MKWLKTAGALILAFVMLTAVGCDSDSEEGTVGSHVPSTEFTVHTFSGGLQDEWATIEPFAITSVEDIEACRERFTTETGYQNFLSYLEEGGTYDETFFTDHALLFALYMLDHGPNDYEVVDVRSQGGQGTVCLQAPYWKDEQIAYQLVTPRIYLIEINRADLAQSYKLEILDPSVGH